MILINKSIQIWIRPGNHGLTSKQLLTESIEIAQERIRRTSLDDQKRANDAAAAKAGFAIVGTVVGVAASFYAGPAAGAAIATGFQITGNIVYAQNTAGISTKTIAEIMHEGQDFYDAIKGLEDKWEKVKDQKETYNEVRAGGKVLEALRLLPESQIPESRIQKPRQRRSLAHLYLTLAKPLWTLPAA